MIAHVVDTMTAFAVRALDEITVALVADNVLRLVFKDTTAAALNALRLLRFRPADYLHNRCLNEGLIVVRVAYLGIFTLKLWMQT